MFELLFILLFFARIFWVALGIWIIFYKIEYPHKTIKQIIQEL